MDDREVFKREVNINIVLSFDLSFFSFFFFFLFPAFSLVFFFIILFPSGFFETREKERERERGEGVNNFQQSDLRAIKPGTGSDQAHTKSLPQSQRVTIK